MPGYDAWFNETFVKEWGRANDTEVTVDNVGLGEINRKAAAEAEAQQGHDIVLFLSPPAAFEDQVIDHREVFQECERRHGKAAEFTVRSSYNPRTDKFYGVLEGYAPAVSIYRRDLWGEVGRTPRTWDDVRKGGRAIKLLHQAPVGISLAPEHNSNYSLRALLFAFGASVQDEGANPALKSEAALEALKFGKALYEEAMVDDVLAWDPPANNRFMLSGEGSLTIDTLSIGRAAESKGLPIDEKLALANLPEGPAGRLGPSFSAYTYVIWKFAENLEGAKRFILDYIGSSKAGLVAGGFQNMPSFPGAVEKLNELLANDPVRPERYKVLAEVPATMTNLGHPGYANAATDEVERSGIIPRMFARVATGTQTPEDSLDQADKEIRPIFDKWREAGKI